MLATGGESGDIPMGSRHDLAADLTVALDCIFSRVVPRRSALAIQENRGVGIVEFEVVRVPQIKLSVGVNIRPPCIVYSLERMIRSSSICSSSRNRPEIVGGGNVLEL